MPQQKFIAWAEEQLKSNATVYPEVYGRQSEVSRLYTPNGTYFLKVGAGLDKEREKLEWLNKKLPVPKIIGFTQIDNKEALLMSAIEGKNLAELCKEWPAEKVVDKLVDTLLQFHAVDTKNCPFGTFGPNKILAHGDACLPNFIFQDDKFSGYIDVGNMIVGSTEIDFAAAIWSLEYNLGPGYGVKFLEKYGLKNVTEELVEKLRSKYEAMQKK